MRRRDFIKVIAGSTAAWPLTARAQQPTIPVIGFFHLTSPETNRENLTTFRQGLGDSGYIENKNVTIEYRWAQGRNDQLATLAADLVRLWLQAHRLCSPVRRSRIPDDGSGPVHLARSVRPSSLWQGACSQSHMANCIIRSRPGSRHLKRSSVCLCSNG